MLLRRGLVVLLVLAAALQLAAAAAGEEDCNDKRERGRRRRGEERRVARAQKRLAAGERRQHGGRADRPDRPRRLPGAGRRRSFITSPQRPLPVPVAPIPHNAIDQNGKEHRPHHGGHHRNNGHHNGHNGHHNGNGLNGNGSNGRPSYLCPAGFVRLGNACYFLSQHIASWQEAHFACRDLGSQLAGLETAWEDNTVRNYLGKSELARLERWIGGIFNWEQRRWIWGSSGKRMSYLGFSRRNSHEDRQWHCVMLDPTKLYRWAHRSCIEQRHFVCEAPLQREMPQKDRNEI